MKSKLSTLLPIMVALLMVSTPAFAQVSAR